MKSGHWKEIYAETDIDECVNNPFLYAENDVENDNTRLITLGYIRGVLDFAKCMKEVLKA